MNVAACIAPIADPAGVRYDIESESLHVAGLTGNPLDFSALAAGRAFLRQAPAGSLIALLAGDAQADAVLREALVRGADRAVRIASNANPDSPVEIARVLARAVERLDCGLVLCGARSADFGGETVGIALAAELDRAAVSRAVALERAGSAGLRVSSKLEGGLRERYTVPLPAVVSVEAELAEPGYLTIMGARYRAGLTRPIEVLEVELAPGERDPSPFEQRIVQTRPRTKQAAAPTSYIGAVAADTAGRAALLDATDENLTRFAGQLEEWILG